MSTRLARAAAIGAAFLTAAAAGHAQAPPSPPKPVAVDGGLTWEVAYLIDTSQDTGGFSQFEWPRSNRGLGLSPDGRFLYVGYNEPNGNPASTEPDHQVRKVDTQVVDVTDATIAVLRRHRGKAIAVDDKGRVYLAEGSDTDVHLGNGGIHVWDADLSVELAVIPRGSSSAFGVSKPEGLTTRRENGVLALYVTDRTTKKLYRFEISEALTGDGITGITKAGLAGGTGEVLVPGATDLRGVKTDHLGRIWMADLGGGKVFRCDPDGMGCLSAAVPRAMDVGLFGSRAYVTQSTAPTAPTLYVLSQDSLAIETPNLSPPWAALELDPLGQRTHDPAKIPLGNFSGVAFTRTAVGDKVMFFANERGQTAHEQSVYGRCDASSDNPGGNCTITDTTKDDNEPVFRFSQPNLPPVAQCKPLLLDADAACRATGPVNDGSFDPDFDAITLTQSSSIYSLGTSSVTLTATDLFGAANSCSAQVVVRDVTPPTLLGCPAPITVSSGGFCSALVNPGSPTGADNCSVSVTGTRSDGLPLFAPFGVGTTTIGWSATDTVSSISCSPQAITVVVTGPTLTITSPAAGAQVPVGSTVTLQGAYTGEVQSATWTVGSQTVAATINPATRTISAPITLTALGSFTVSLAASNGCGGDSSAGIPITVFQPCTGRIGDFVWNDLNANGIQNAGEPGLGGLTVQLKDSTGAVLQTTTTNAGGFYEFIGVCAGTYRVVVVAPGGFTATLTQASGSSAANDSNAVPATVTLPTNSSTNLTIDFGFVKFATGHHTQTQGGWGSTPSGENPGTLLATKFAAVYPRGVTIGGDKTLTFTKASAIEAFLPQGSTADVLKKSATNPIGSTAGVFAGQVLALQLSVSFSAAGLTKPGLGELTVITGPLAGYTVNEVLALANKVLGGMTSALPAGMTVSTLNEVVDAVNNNFVDGTENDGYLR